MKNNNKISHSGDGQQYIETLIESGTPHILVYTNNSVSVTVGETVSIFTDADLAPKELGFIGRAKNDVIENAERLRIPERNPIFYKIYDVKNGNIPELAEVDISAAFWETAKIEGIISDKIYTAGKDCRKVVRLIAFGAAATVKRTFEYNGKEYINMSEDFNRYGRAAYFYVSSKVVTLMREICDSLPGMVLLYWVDAIVCYPQYADFVIQEFKKHGYDCHVKSLKNCKFDRADGIKSLTVTEIETGREKTFKEFPRRKNNFEYSLNANFKK